MRKASQRKRKGRHRELEAIPVSPWNKCTHRHESTHHRMVLGSILGQRELKPSRRSLWQGKLVRLKGAGPDGTCVPGKRAGS